MSARIYIGRPGTIVRHVMPPPAHGCRWCGYLMQGHDRIHWTAAKKFHEYEAPTAAQVIARLNAHAAMKAGRVGVELITTANPARVSR